METRFSTLKKLWDSYIVGMNELVRLFVMVIFLLMTVNSTSAVPKIIFDSDIARVDSLGNDMSDIDDLGALAILNALANKGLCEIICVVTNSRSNYVVEMIDAVNNYYYNTGIPIGIKGGSSVLIEDHNSYAKVIASRFNHSQKSANAYSSTKVLRQVLSSISESDTVIYIHADAISSWDFLSIASFVESGPDDISELTGWQLLNSKVDQFVSYVPCLPNDGVSENCPDWSNQPTTNVSKLQYFLNSYSNHLIGNTTAVEEAHLPTRLWQQSIDNPVKIAYEYYYSQTPPPWHESNEVPESISIYGDGLGVFFAITSLTNSHLFSQENEGRFVLHHDKLRWSKQENIPKHSYFYTAPDNKQELWVMLDELICHRPIP